MLRACKYCGRIHDSKYDCGMKPKRNKGISKADKFRWTAEWQNKRKEIKERDHGLCQVCLRGLHLLNDSRLYNFNEIQVHHIISLANDYSKRLDNDNLISVCPYHHELAENGKISVEELMAIANEQEGNSPPTI